MWLKIIRVLICVGIIAFHSTVYFTASVQHAFIDYTGIIRFLPKRWSIDSLKWFVCSSVVYIRGGDVM